MLSRRPHSERELRHKLAEREHGPGAIDAAVERLQELVSLERQFSATHSSAGLPPASPEGWR